MGARRIQSSWDFRRPHTLTGELAALNRSTSRVGLLKTNLRLLCLVNRDHGVQKVIDVFGTLAKLQCSCRREIEEGLGNKIKRLEAEIERESKRGSIDE